MLDSINDEILGSIDKDIEAGYEVIIDSQLNDPIVDKLTGIFEDFSKIPISDKKNTKKYLKRFNDAIEVRFGLPVVGEISIEETGFGTFPMFIDKNVLSDFNDINVTQGSPKIIRELVKSNKENRKHPIVIDKKNAKVIGLDKDKKTIIYLGTCIFKNSIGEQLLTPKELTAITLHEIGHIFTYTAARNRIYKNMTPLLDSFLAFNDKDVSKAEKIILQGYKVKKLDKKTATKIIGTIQKDLTVYVEANRAKISTMPESKVTTTRDSEMEADSFASRFGVGKELTSGLIKIVGNNSYISTMKNMEMLFIIQSLVNILSAIFSFNFNALVKVIISGIVFTILISVLLMLMAVVFLYIFGKDSGFIYENLVNRISSMKREYIKTMREQNLSKEVKLSIIKNIEYIEEMVKKLKANGYDKLFNTALSYNVNAMPNMNAEYLYTQAMQILENNDLHYLADKIAIGNNAK